MLTVIPSHENASSLHGSARIDWRIARRTCKGHRVKVCRGGSVRFKRRLPRARHFRGRRQSRRIEFGAVVTSRDAQEARKRGESAYPVKSRSTGVGQLL